jgi:tetratricopeptide (TPR) repeat protein
MRFLAIAALVAMVSAAPLRAQGQRPTSPPGSSTGNPAYSTRPLSSTSSTPFPGSSGPSIVLMGKVVIEGASTPDTPVKIERVCGAAPRPEGFTDGNGDFSITIGQEQSAMPDASENAGRNTVATGPAARGLNPLSGCELRAVLAGFRSDSISLNNVRYMDNPNVGTIFLHRLSNAGGLTTSATSELAPKDARKAYERALEDMKKQKPDDAQSELLKAVELYPKYAAAWLELGRVYEFRHHAGEARDAYHQSIAGDSRFIPPYERLYLMAYHEDQWQETADLSDRVLRMNPFDFPDAYYYNAIANMRLDRLDAAEKSAREAVERFAAHPKPNVYYALGYILARKQNYPEAAENLKAYLALAPAGKLADEVRRQLSEIERAAQAH